jgi:competence protein ComEC
VRIEAALERACREDRWAGFAQVTDGPEHLRFLEGHRLFLSLRGVQPGDLERGREIRVVGLLRHLPAAPDTTFDRYLVASSAVAALDRSRMTGTATSPGPIRSRINWLAGRLREALQRGLEDHPAEAALLVAMKLGSKGAASDAQREAFIRTGTQHLFAISGMHIAVIAGTVVLLVSLIRIPAPVPMLAGLAWSGLHVLATGASPSATRAWILVASLCLSKALLRNTNGMALWCVTAVPILLADPQAVQAPGFQLSYSVVAGLVLMAAPLANWLSGEAASLRDPPGTGWVRSKARALRRFAAAALATSLTSALCALPASISTFEGVSTGSILANCFMVPVASLAVAAGVGATLLDLVGLTQGAILCNHASALCMRFLSVSAEFLAGFDWMYVTRAWRYPVCGAVAAALLAGTLGAGAALRWRHPGLFLMPPAVLIAWLLIASIEA